MTSPRLVLVVSNSLPSPTSAASSSSSSDLPRPGRLFGLLAAFRSTRVWLSRSLHCCCAALAARPLRKCWTAHAPSARGAAGVLSSSALNRRRAPAQCLFPERGRTGAVERINRRRRRRGARGWPRRTFGFSMWGHALRVPSSAPPRSARASRHARGERASATGQRSEITQRASAAARLDERKRAATDQDQPDHGGSDQERADGGEEFAHQLAEQQPHVAASRSLPEGESAWRRDLNQGRQDHHHREVTRQPQAEFALRPAAEERPGDQAKLEREQPGYDPEALSQEMRNEPASWPNPAVRGHTRIVRLDTTARERQKHENRPSNQQKRRVHVSSEAEPAKGVSRAGCRCVRGMNILAPLPTYTNVLLVHDFLPTDMRHHRLLESRASRLDCGLRSG